MVMADLARALSRDVEMDWMAVSSYGSGTKSSGVVRILKDLDGDIMGRNVLVVEDIIDSGLTLSWLLANLASRGPASVEVVHPAPQAGRDPGADRRALRRLRHPERVRRRVRPGLRRSASATSGWSDAGAARLHDLAAGRRRAGNSWPPPARCDSRLRQASVRVVGVPSAPQCRRRSAASDRCCPRPLRRGVPVHRAAAGRSRWVVEQEGRGARRPSSSMDFRRFFRGPIFWIVLAVFGVLLVGQVLTAGGGFEEADTSRCINEIEDGNAQSVKHDRPRPAARGHARER